VEQRGDYWTVLDQRGGAILRKTIVVTNVATGQKERKVVSTGSGTFNVSSLPRGTYGVEITQRGFPDFLLKRFLFK